ncbi:LuxR C-terminal-related transcriptional regulator [Micromonospora sp. BQ11]|uniref:LuxR C-terminal-related transcriptional regulator n=1 Tax=Micromonospora sp. BQ11 TaxID=3452212 RepID=UPI003F8B9409
MSLASGPTWPLTGRDAEVAEIAALMTHPTPHTVLIVGPAGVGKTRLAREVLSRLQIPHEQVLVAVATASAVRIPFGALAHLLPAELPTAEGRHNLLRVLADGLLTTGRGGDRVLLVDDVHLLDGNSAALLLHLAVRATARIVLTARSGVELPDAVAALTRGDYASRINLSPLTREAVRSLLETALGRPVQTATVRWLWQHSGGNVLWLQQLVEAGLASGTLVVIDDIWRWQGPLQISAPLADLVRHRIGQLSPAAQRAAELLAHGEPLGLAILEKLVDPIALDDLESRDLVRWDVDDQRVHVRLAHPIYAEVLRQQTSPRVRRQHCRDLATAVEATGMRRREDILRVSSWRLDSGDLKDPDFLLAAAGRALSAIDFTLAARLARAACDSGGGAPARRVLAATLGYSGRTAESERLLSVVPQAGVSSLDELRSVQLRALNMFMGLDRPTDALDLLARTEQATTEPVVRAELAAVQAILHAIQGDWSAYAQATSRAGQPSTPSPHTTAMVLYADCVQRFHHGQPDAALRLSEQALAVLPDDDDLGWLRPGLLSWQCTTRAFAGRLAEAEVQARAGYEQAQRSGWLADQLSWLLFLARATARQGRLRSARRCFREAIDLTRDGSPWGPPAMLLGEWATVEALLGDVTRAQTLLDQAHLARVEGYRIFHMLAFQMAQPWILAAEGRIAEAVTCAVRAADDARQQQARLWEVDLLHVPVRLGQPATVLDRLAELRTASDAPHVALYADHAAALMAHDGAALDRVCTDFEAIGMTLHAAEAAAHAAEAWRHLGRTARAHRAADRCRQLAQRCQGAVTPAVLACRTPTLTARERDIARLAAAGHSSQQIAQRLGVAVRTVDNHLHRVYRKLDIRGRSELPAALAIPEDPAPDGDALR